VENTGYARVFHSRQWSNYDVVVFGIFLEVSKAKQQLKEVKERTSIGCRDFNGLMAFTRVLTN